MNKLRILNNFLEISTTLKMFSRLYASTNVMDYVDVSSANSSIGALSPNVMLFGR